VDTFKVVTSLRGAPLQDDTSLVGGGHLSKVDTSKAGTSLSWAPLWEVHLSKVDTPRFDSSLGSTPFCSQNNESCPSAGEMEKKKDFCFFAYWRPVHGINLFILLITFRCKASFTGTS